MSRLRARDDDAARDVFERYARRLIALARSRLERAVQQKVDPEDVLQSVFRSFFARQADGRLEIDDWDGLWTILTCITVRKCLNKRRFFLRDRRDVRRESAPTAAGENDSTPSWQFLADEPSPEEAAVLAETVESLMSQLDERDRRIVTLSLQGYAVREVAEDIGYAERTVRRTLANVREYLNRLRNADEFRDAA